MNYKGYAFFIFSVITAPLVQGMLERKSLKQAVPSLQVLCAQAIARQEIGLESPNFNECASDYLYLAQDYNDHKDDESWKQWLFKVACIKDRYHAAAFLARGIDFSPFFASEAHATTSILIVAARKGHYRVVDLLVSQGAPITKADKFGRTPLSAAQEYNRVKTTQLLSCAQDSISPR